MDGVTRKEMIEQFGRGYDDLIDTLMEIPKEAWWFKSSDDKWSINEIIVHLVDSETHGYLRCRMALAESGHQIMAYNQQEWAARLNYNEKSTEDYLELFKWLRLTTYDLIAALPESEWEKYYMHPERGEETLEGWLTIYVNHVGGHIRQIKQNYEEWKES